MRTAIALAAATLAAAPSLATGVTTAIPLGPCPSPGLASPDQAGALAGQINAYRSGRALRPLRLTSPLAAVAQRRSLDQVAAHQMAHAMRGGRLAWAPPGRWAGENLALAPDPPTALRAMLGSTTHRRLLLSRRWRFMGVGAATTCAGTVYTVSFLR